MDTTEKYRPRLHFSPASGWMNDPNGLIFVDGRYHLFYQHDPHSVSHGPMHWGHASSENLVDWEEHAIALRPDAHGACWSGSAIETDEKEIKLFYTAHRQMEDGRDFESQCLVHADRSLETFIADPANPVLPNPGLEVFRDPRVIWHEECGQWIMLVTMGEKIGFYGSANLVDWTFLSIFGDLDGCHNGSPWECPDLVKLSAPDGSMHWVLIVGIGNGAYAAGSGTQYFVGAFDGSTFTNANAPHTILWLDHGRDCYATQTFFDSKAQRILAVAWASNWLYARVTPTSAFRGTMTLPREIRLIGEPGRLRLAMHVPTSVHRRFPCYDPVTSDGTYRWETLVRLEPGEEQTIAFFGEDVPHFTLCRDSPSSGRIRTSRDTPHGIPDFAHDYEVEIAWPEGSLDLTLYVDQGVVELCADRGRVWITNLAFPEEAAGALSINVRQGATLRDVA
jgi:fructan beta-fructosidase